MKIRITGASGYIGSIVSAELRKRGHEVSAIKRQLLYRPNKDLQKEIKHSNVIIHLAGSPILRFWTNKNKASIYDSRVRTTTNLVNAINGLPEVEQPNIFISASAIGIYKAGYAHDESSSNFDEGFIGNIVEEWENASSKLSPNIRRNIFRIGLVLGRKAKTIKNLLLPFKLGLGGTIGNGKQAFPYIHEKDLINAFVWVVEEYNKSGVLNLVAPESITNKIFTKNLSKKLNRSAFIPVPDFVLRILYGEAASLLLESPVVEPKRILEEGFEFEYPTIKTALKEILEN